MRSCSLLRAGAPSAHLSECELALETIWKRLVRTAVSFNFHLSLFVGLKHMCDAILCNMILATVQVVLETPTTAGETIQNATLWKVSLWCVCQDRSCFLSGTERRPYRTRPYGCRSLNITCYTGNVQVQLSDLTEIPQSAICHCDNCRITTSCCSNNLPVPKSSVSVTSGTPKARQSLLAFVD